MTYANSDCTDYLYTNVICYELFLTDHCILKKSTLFSLNIQIQKLLSIFILILEVEMLKTAGI